MPKQNLSKKILWGAQFAFKDSSEELRDLVEFFIDTGCETARDSGNSIDALVIRMFVMAFCPDQAEAMEGKLTGKIVTR